MKFKNKKEFLKALIEHGVLYGDDMTAKFEINSDHGFVIDCKDHIKAGHKLVGSYYNYDWSTTETLKDKDLVWAWDNLDKTYRVLGFYEAKNKCLFCRNGERRGFRFASDYYEKYEGEWPEWAKEAYNKLED